MSSEIDEAIFEKDLFGQPIVPVRPGPLTERFLIPPFTVLDSRGGYWQDRKRAWIGLGIKSEIGRGDELTFSKSLQNPEKYKNQGKMGTTSIFDPVLCESLYRWFCPAGGQIIDPFSGGSVQGDRNAKRKSNKEVEIVRRQDRRS